jgi:nucleotide-binding universal stress UspA family protein
MITRRPAHFASPPRRLVIGCDGSEGARDAAALARRLAPEDASFLLVDVAPRHALPRRLGDHRPADFSAARHALAAGGPATASIETRTVRADSPAEALADIGGDERRDLIVVGSPHRGLLGRVLLGSVAKSLLHCSSVPVAVAPKGFARDGGGDRKLADLVVGFDGSDEAGAALDWAEPLAAARGAELEVFTVATPPVSIPGALGYRAPGPAEPFEPLEEAVDRVEDGLEMHAHLRVGHAAPSLAAACRGADLLIIGTQTHGALEEALIGSVADALVAEPSCPVVAVPVRSGPPTGRRSGPDGADAETAKDGAA